MVINNNNGEFYYEIYYNIFNYLIVYNIIKQRRKEQLQILIDSQT